MKIGYSSVIAYTDGKLFDDAEKIVIRNSEYLKDFVAK